MPIRACVVCAAAGVSMGVSAQPQVPAGLSARQIAPLLDGQTPELTAIDDSVLGSGVIAATENNVVVSFRLVESTGLIRTIGTQVIDIGRPLDINRVRTDSTGAFGGLLHSSVTSGTGVLDQDTRIYTIEQGMVSERSVGPRNDSKLDIEFLADVGNGQPGIVFLDGNSNNGTQVGYFDVSYSRIVTRTNSVPPGRTDTDVKGFRKDSTGLFGGGVLVADTDDSDLRTAIYELSNVASGGEYRPIFGPVNWDLKRYGDLDIASMGTFGGVIYITETLTDEIQQVAPDGTHTTWATGFTGIDSLSISPDGESMYVADLNGVWLIRPAGNEPGPAVVATDPSVPAGTTMTGDPVDALRVIFTEPVSFTDADVTITNAAGQPVAFDASGSGSQFMIIGLAAPLSGDDYTVTLADTITSVATAQPLDGDNDGIAGGDASFTFTHRCLADDNLDGNVTPADFNGWILNFNAGCP